LDLYNLAKRQKITRKLFLSQNKFASPAYEKSDIVVFLVAHDPFKSLPWREDKIILDFCGVFKKTDYCLLKIKPLTNQFFTHKADS
jgi:UDP-N-acetyl-D-mannosaminuronate dehydrogenase